MLKGSVYSESGTTGGSVGDLENIVVNRTIHVFSSIIRCFLYSCTRSRCLGCKIGSSLFRYIRTKAFSAISDQ